MLAIDGCSKGNDHFRNTSIDGIQGIFYLGQHTARDGAVGFILIK